MSTLVLASLVLMSCEGAADRLAAPDPGPETVSLAAVFAASSHAVRGDLAGTATPTLLDAAQSLFRVDVAATGVITGVGRVSARWALPQVVLDLANGQGVALSATWTGVITAQNGDQLLGQYTLRGTNVPVDVTGSFLTVADLAITGGTGRFQQASGSGTSVVRGNVLTRSIQVELAGALAARAP